MMKTYKKADLHVHSYYSDGSDNPLDIARQAQGLLDVFALTDHDSIKGCRDILATNDRPAFIPGIEFSCSEDQGRCHILGYGYDIDNQSMIDLTDEIHMARVDKVVKTFEFLEGEFGLNFRSEDKNSIINSHSPNHSSIGWLMVREGIVSNQNEAFTKYIDFFHGKTSYITPEQAIKVILKAGGTPVLAHGVRGDGGSRLGYEETLDRVKRFKELGLMGVECYYSEFTEEEHQVMMRIASEEGLLITAGSDYHGTNKKIALGDTGVIELDSEVLKRFLEQVQVY